MQAIHFPGIYFPNGLRVTGITSGVAQWLACWAHNPKVPGSKPGSASFPCIHISTVSDFQDIIFEHAAIAQW